MEGFWTSEFFLYLALLCICASFFFYMRSRKIRKKELELRRSLSQKIRGKFGRKNKPGTPEINI